MEQLYLGMVVYRGNCFAKSLVCVLNQSVYLVILHYSYLLNTVKSSNILAHS